MPCTGVQVSPAGPKKCIISVDKHIRCVALLRVERNPRFILLCEDTRLGSPRPCEGLPIILQSLWFCGGSVFAMQSTIPKRSPECTVFLSVSFGNTLLSQDASLQLLDNLSVGAWKKAVSEIKAKQRLILRQETHRKRRHEMSLQASRTMPTKYARGASGLSGYIRKRSTIVLPIPSQLREYLRQQKGRLLKKCQLSSENEEKGIDITSEHQDQSKCFDKDVDRLDSDDEQSVTIASGEEDDGEDDDDQEDDDEEDEEDEEDEDDIVDDEQEDEELGDVDMDMEDDDDDDMQ